MLACAIIGLVLLANILLVEIFNWLRNASIARKLDRMLNSFLAQAAEEMLDTRR